MYLRVLFGELVGCGSPSFGGSSSKKGLHVLSSDEGTKVGTTKGISMFPLQRRVFKYDFGGKFSRFSLAQ
jgi:hypothetical protein